MPYYLVSLGKSLGCEEALVNPESSWREWCQASPTLLQLQPGSDFNCLRPPSQNCPAKPFQNSWPTKSVINNKGLLLLQAIKFWGDVFCSTDNTLQQNSGVTASAKPTWLTESGLDAPLRAFVPPASFNSRPYCTTLSPSTTSLPTRLQFLKAGTKSIRLSLFIAYLVLAMGRHSVRREGREGRPQSGTGCSVTQVKFPPYRWGAMWLRQGIQPLPESRIPKI